MAHNTSASMSATLMKQVWIEKFLKELRSRLVFRDLGEMGKAPGQNGEIIHWLSMADMSLHTTAATENKIVVLIKSLLNTLGTLSYLT